MSEQTVTNAKCSECGSTYLVRDIEMGESICSDWGLVIRENILYRRAEWRVFIPEERKSKARAGAPTKYSHFAKGLPTIIRIDRDASGRPLSAKVDESRIVCP